MKLDQNRIRPPVKWFGGKYYLAQKIISLIPPHHTYVEPFGGAASVLLNKEPSPVEIYNDIDGRIVRLFRVLRDHPDEFLRRLKLTPYSEEEWLASDQPADDDIEAARRDFIRWRMSIAGRGEAFSFTLHRSRRGMADVVSGFLSAIDEVLPLIIERFRRVQILNRDAFEVIQKWDSEQTVFYCDPPYHPDTLADGKSGYNYTLSRDQHLALLQLLKSCRGYVILSGYAHPDYDRELSSWRRVTYDIAKHAAKSKCKQHCEEVIWCNR